MCTLSCCHHTISTPNTVTYPSVPTVFAVCTAVLAVVLWNNSASGMDV